MQKTILTISIVFLAIVTVMATVAFYWFQLRPEQIRKNCYKNLPELDKRFNSYQGDYDRCLVEHGLEK